MLGSNATSWSRPMLCTKKKMKIISLVSSFTNDVKPQILVLRKDLFSRFADTMNKIFKIKFSIKVSIVNKETMLYLFNK